MPKSKSQQQEGTAAEENDFSGNSKQNNSIINANLIFRIVKYVGITAIVILLISGFFIPFVSTNITRNHRNNYCQNQLTTGNTSMVPDPVQQADILGTIHAETNPKIKTQQVLTNTYLNHDKNVISKKNQITSNMNYDYLLEDYLNNFFLVQHDKYLTALIEKTLIAFNQGKRTESILATIIINSDQFDDFILKTAHEAYQFIEPATAYGAYAKSIFYYKFRRNYATYEEEYVNLLYNAAFYLGKALDIKTSAGKTFFLANTTFNNILKKVIQANIYETNLITEITLKLAKEMQTLADANNDEDIESINTRIDLFKIALKPLKLLIKNISEQTVEYHKITKKIFQLENLISAHIKQITNPIPTESALHQSNNTTAQRYLIPIAGILLPISIGIFFAKKWRAKPSISQVDNQLETKSKHKKQRNQSKYLATQTFETVSDNKPASITLEQKIDKLKNKISKVSKDKINELMKIIKKISSYIPAESNIKEPIISEKMQGVIATFHKNYSNRITALHKRFEQMENDINQLNPANTAESRIEETALLIGELNQSIDTLFKEVSHDHSIQTLEKESKKIQTRKDLTEKSINNSISAPEILTTKTSSHNEITIPVSIQTTEPSSTRNKKGKEKEKEDTATTESETLCHTTQLLHIDRPEKTDEKLCKDKWQLDDSDTTTASVISYVLDEMSADDFEEISKLIINLKDFEEEPESSTSSQHFIFPSL